MEIGWTPACSINAPCLMRFAFNTHNASTSPAFQINMGHSPTRRKTLQFACIKCRGAISDCITAPIILSGPTNQWALHLPTPLPCGAPHGRPCGPTWPPTMCPRHLHLAWAIRGLTATLHPRKSCAPRQLRAPHHRLCHVIRGVCGIKKTPLFRDFNKKN